MAVNICRCCAIPEWPSARCIIDGFSKSFAMTGWRLGYTVAPPEVIPALNLMVVNTYTCVAEFTQYAAIEALRDREGNTPRMVARVCAPSRSVRARFEPAFRASAACRPTARSMPGLRSTGTGMSAEELCRILLEDAGVAAIPGAAFGACGERFHPLLVRIIDGDLARSGRAHSEGLFSMAGERSQSGSDTSPIFVIRGNYATVSSSFVVLDCWWHSVRARLVRFQAPTFSRSTNACCRRSKRSRLRSSRASRIRRRSRR